MLSKFLILIFIAHITHSFAGNEVGNGGDAVVCPSQKPVLLDFYENKYIKNSYELVKSEKVDEYEYLKDIWKGLAAISPKFHTKYLSDLLNLKSKLNFLPSTEFRDVKDSYHIAIPKECEILQVAIQRKESRSKNTVIYINKDLYEKMDTHQKAGLISHEIIYEHFKFFGHNHSVNVREFNRFIFSKRILKKNKADFIKLIQGMDIPSY